MEEYVEGDNLATLLSEARFTPSEARRIVSQLCSALWILHSMGIVIDFDASRVFKNEESRDTQVLGTTGYAAPEQYGIAQTDERADLYSLGVLLNILLTGKHPSRELAPGHLGRIVQKCTMVNPKKRFKNVLYLMEAL